MDSNALKAILVLKGMRVDDLIRKLKENQGLNLSKSAFYRKLKGKCEFDRREILAISKELKIGPEKMMSIFFNEKVS
ncbi:BetR domain protein [Cohnella sp.]|uniref:BetR domain protein n=1 Tax=Cohnella sp. TaxID=1883426 RepID=UPI003568B5D7